MTPYLRDKALYLPFIHTKASPLLGIVVVIPCHDEDFLLLSLMSLHKCDRPPCDVEVIVVVNEGEAASEAVLRKNQETVERASQWAQENNRPPLRFHVMHTPCLPRKHAGVGLARKIGMDEACYRFERAGNPRGIIACFDADSRCERNYLQAIFRYFADQPKAQAAGIYFEHPVSGPDFEDEVYEAIARYELHLRYYVAAQRWAGFPHAWQTIGSSMAVRSDAYQQQGGMNRRQAGEDFYFLHKFIPLGGFGEITDTKVIPSPRPSHRVPFGTGKAVGDLIGNGGPCLTYNPQSFEELAFFFKLDRYAAVSPAALLDQLPEGVRDFLVVHDFPSKMEEIRLNTAGPDAFHKRFWRWFDAFMMMKYAHFMREFHHPAMEVGQASAWLLQRLGLETVGLSTLQLLETFRKRDRSGL